MPRLTPSGVSVFGLGRIPLDDSRVIGQQIVNGDWRICVDDVPVAPQGCNALAASDGYWIAWLAGYGLFDASGLISATAGLPATQDGRSPSAPDGTIAIVVDRNNGRGLRLINGGVVTAEVPDALLTDQLCVVNRTQALWIDAGTRGLRTCGGLPAPSILPGPMGWPHVLNVNGELWLSYQSTDAAGMVLHPFTSFRGYRITLPPAFYQDAVVLAGGIVRLTWANTPADTDVEYTDVDVAREGRADLRDTSPQPPPPPPLPEKPMSVPNESEFVIRFIGPRLRRLNSLDETRANTFEAVNAGCANRHAGDDGWGLLEKTGGDRVRDRAADIWAYDLGDGTCQLVDVVSNAEGDGGSPAAAWGIVPPERAGIRPISQWRVPFDVQPPVDPPPPPPPPPSDDIAKLRAEVSELRTLTRKLDADIGATDARARALAERVEELEHKPDPVVKLPKLRVKGSTSRTFGHGHTVDLEVVQE